jgi:hypothetical protein
LGSLDPVPYGAGRWQQGYKMCWGLLQKPCLPPASLGMGHLWVRAAAFGLCDRVS